MRKARIFDGVRWCAFFRTKVQHYHLRWIPFCFSPFFVTFIIYFFSLSDHWKQSCKAWRGVRIIQTGCLFKCTIDIHRLHRPRNKVALWSWDSDPIPKLAATERQILLLSCPRQKRMVENKGRSAILPNVGLTLTTFWTLTCFAVVVTPPALSDNICLGSAIRWDILSNFLGVSLSLMTLFRKDIYSPPARWGSLDFIRVAFSSAFFSSASLGFELRVPDRNGHCRTSTASSRSVGTARLQPGAPDLSGHCRASARRRRECKIECQIECQGMCQKECQIECQGMCQKECRNKCAIYI